MRWLPSLTELPAKLAFRLATMAENHEQQWGSEVA